MANFFAKSFAKGRLLMRLTTLLAIALYGALLFHSNTLANDGNDLVVVETVKFLANDGRSQDGFGKSVDIYQGRVVVGAWESDNLAQGDAGRNAGSAYVFDSNRQQVHKLSASDGNGSANFGISVAIDNQYVLVGSPRNREKGIEAGSVYVYDANTGQELRKLIHDELSTDDEFGFSVDLDQGVALVGAWSENVAGHQSGAAYLFDVAGGQPLHRLLPEDIENSFLFGNSVSLSGSRALVGAYGSGPGTRRGAAYIFDTANGEQLTKLTPADGAELSEFGYSVALSDTIAVIGAPNHAPDGAAYLFDIETGQEIRKILAPADAGNNFGSSVAIHGDAIAIGASESDLVVLFDRATGDRVSALKGSDLTGGAQFAESIAIDADGSIIVGAPHTGDYSQQLDKGAAYLFFAVPEPSTGWIAVLALALSFTTRCDRPRAEHQFRIDVVTCRFDSLD